MGCAGAGGLPPPGLRSWGAMLPLLVPLRGRSGTAVTHATGKWGASDAWAGAAPRTRPAGHRPCAAGWVVDVRGTQGVRLLSHSLRHVCCRVHGIGGLPTGVQRLARPLSNTLIARTHRQEGSEDCPAMGAAGGGGGDGAAAWEAAPAVFFRPCALEDLDRVAALEASRAERHQRRRSRAAPPPTPALAPPRTRHPPTTHPPQASSYPPEEAAPRERLEQRLQTAGDYFLAAVHSAPDATSASTSPELVGFCCGTLTTADHLTHESMMLHEPEGGKEGGAPDQLLVAVCAIRCHHVSPYSPTIPRRTTHCRLRGAVHSLGVRGRRAAAKRRRQPPAAGVRGVGGGRQPAPS